MTNREVYDVIEKVFANSDIESREDILEWVTKNRAALDKKNEKARERAALKRAAADELKARIENLLTEEPKTVNVILMELGEDNLTPSKVVARMTSLIDEGKATKESIKTDSGKRVAYTRTNYITA